MTHSVVPEPRPAFVVQPWMKAAAPLALGAIALAALTPDPAPILAASAAIQIHLVCAAAIVVLGAVMMVSRKGRTFHRIAGWTWAGLMLVVAVSSLFITELNGDKLSWIHLLSGWTLLVLPLTLVAARRHKVSAHRRGMMGMYYGGLLIAGGFAFMPGRVLWQVFFG